MARSGSALRRSHPTTVREEREPGTRLLLPAGLKAVPVVDYYHRPRLAPAASTWPPLRAADDTTVDASVIPDRVMWDAGKMPFLFVYGEFGGTDEEPFRNQFYTLAPQPMSRNPYLRGTTIL